MRRKNTECLIHDEYGDENDTNEYNEFSDPNVVFSVPAPHTKPVWTERRNR
jgi:hypothetical protein